MWTEQQTLSSALLFPLVPECFWFRREWFSSWLFSDSVSSVRVAEARVEMEKLALPFPQVLLSCTYKWLVLALGEKAFCSVVSQKTWLTVEG